MCPCGILRFEFSTMATTVSRFFHGQKDGGLPRDFLIDTFAIRNGPKFFALNKNPDSNRHKMARFTRHPEKRPPRRRTPLPPRAVFDVVGTKRRARHPNRPTGRLKIVPSPLQSSKVAILIAIKSPPAAAPFRRISGREKGELYEAQKEVPNSADPIKNRGCRCWPY